MIFLGKLIDELTEEHLKNLIGTIETTTIDVKRDAYVVHDSKSREQKYINFCTDLVSFANAKGGWIICGMKDKNGEISELTGISEKPNIEREIARLESIANSSIEPIIPGLRFSGIKLENGKYVLAIYIPRSFAAPHRVVKTSKFHIRRSGRNDEMTLDELRTQFNLAESHIEKIRSFRADRVNKIAKSKKTGEFTPFALEDGAQLILHFIPINFSEKLVDLSQLMKDFSSEYGG